MQDIVNLFLKLISFDTMSNPLSHTFPSSPSEIEFGKVLLDLLKDEGVNECYQDNFGYIYGRIDNNKEETIALIAHMDTSPSLMGGIKNPRIIKKYDGTEIFLNNKYSIKPEEFPHLNDLVGEDIIVTDGEHLLGGDDKAGIAIILSFISYYLRHKEDFNYNLAFSFTPDEEIGKGASKFDVKKINANYAFTLDGGSIYEASYENFNASSAILTIYGVGVHPGSAKDIMVNAFDIGCLFCSRLPLNMKPETTTDHEGFIHLVGGSGDVEKTTLEFILRDHDKTLMEEKKKLLEKEVEKMEKEFPKAQFYLNIKDEYKNMFDYFKTDMKCIDLINKAYLRSNTRLEYVPIRGGTDGATITYMGLPCPNLGVGDFSPHGRYEIVSITQMIKMVDILKELYK